MEIEVKERKVAKEKLIGPLSLWFGPGATVFLDDSLEFSYQISGGKVLVTGTIEPRRPNKSRSWGVNKVEEGTKLYRDGDFPFPENTDKLFIPNWQAKKVLDESRKPTQKKLPNF